MTEKTYNAYEYAKELGFSEADAQALGSCAAGSGADATNIRRIARGKGLLPELPSSGGRTEEKPKTEPVQPQQHKHSYRKDGTCACGRKRKVKATKAE